MCGKVQKKELAEFKRLLLELRRKLTNNIGQLHNDALKTAGETVDELSDVSAEHIADRGSDNFVRDLKIGILQDSDAELCDVNLALEKIEQGRLRPLRALRRRDRHQAPARAAVRTPLHPVPPGGGAEERVGVSWRCALQTLPFRRKG